MLPQCLTDMAKVIIHVLLDLFINIYAQACLYTLCHIVWGPNRMMLNINSCHADRARLKRAASPGYSTICFILGYVYCQIGEVIVCKQRLTQFPLSAPHLCPPCLTLCLWQFAPIVQHFLMGGTRRDWAQSTAKECDIPF